MKRSSVLVPIILFGYLLTACLPATEVDGPASFELPLHPSFSWSAPRETVRTLTAPDEDVRIEGKETIAVYDDAELLEFYFPESDFPDQDFWRYYLGEETVQQLGYSQILAEEEAFDRQFIALSDEGGHVLMLSNLVEFAEPFPEAPQCPCTYTFTIFTNDQRILLR